MLQGCDGSVLLDDTETLIGEKQAEQSVNSLKGFDLVDKIKEKLEAECPGVVTCADLLAIAARDAVVLVRMNNLYLFYSNLINKLQKCARLINKFTIWAGWRAVLGCAGGSVGCKESEPRFSQQ